MPHSFLWWTHTDTHGDCSIHCNISHSRSHNSLSPCRIRRILYQRTLISLKINYICRFPFLPNIPSNGRCLEAIRYTHRPSSTYNRLNANHRRCECRRMQRVKGNEEKQRRNNFNWTFWFRKTRNISHLSLNVSQLYCTCCWSNCPHCACSCTSMAIRFERRPKRKPEKKNKKRNRKPSVDRSSSVR